MHCIWIQSFIFYGMLKWAFYIRAHYLNDSNHSGFFYFLEIETLEIVKKSNLSYRAPIEVMKTGRKTDTTFGYLIDPKKHEFLSARLDSTCHSIQHYVFKMPYVVKDKDESERFFLRGDSGSGVFLLGETGLPEKALGIAFGYLYKKPYTFVCNIEDILEKLGLKLVRWYFGRLGMVYKRLMSNLQDLYHYYVPHLLFDCCFLKNRTTGMKQDEAHF